MSTPEVKKLAWIEHKSMPHMWYADRYRIMLDRGTPDLYIVSGWDRGTNPYETLEAAQAAAQAAFERYVLSCLVPVSPDPELVKALEEAEETLRLAERPAFRDPQYGDLVEHLGDSIGYGALMSSASASWRKRAAEKGDPVGGEFVAGPCHSTVIRTLGIVRAALAKVKGQ